MALTAHRRCKALPFTSKDVANEVLSRVAVHVVQNHCSLDVSCFTTQQLLIVTVSIVLARSYYEVRLNTMYSGGSGNFRPGRRLLRTPRPLRQEITAAFCSLYFVSWSLSTFKQLKEQQQQHFVYLSLLPNTTTSRATAAAAAAAAEATRRAQSSKDDHAQGGASQPTVDARKLCDRYYYSYHRH
jgi:hypothetical protein